MNTMPEKKNGRKKKSKLRKWIAVVAVLAIVAVVGMSGLKRTQTDKAITYQEYTASIGTISNSLSFSGSLQPVDSATYTASSSTTIRDIYVTEGQSVQEGDKLIRLASGQTIEAEFDGTVNKIYFKEDDEVSPSDALIHVIDFENMKVSVHVDEYDIADVQVGDVCRITTTATEETFESVISSIDHYSSASGSVAYYTADAYVSVGEGVYPGMQVTLTIPQEEANDVVILKVDALIFDVTNNAYVLVKNESGELVKVDVEIGVSNGNYIEIASGLSEGDVVYAEKQDSGDPFAAMFGNQPGGGSSEAGSSPTGGGNPMGGGEMPSFGGGQ